MDKLSYMVDSSLGAVPLAKMNRFRTSIQTKKTLASGNPIASDRPVMTGSQQLQANVLYESSNSPNVRYYLPQYKIAANGGKPAVELRYSGGDSPEVGRLTVELDWTPPPAQRGVEVRAMDHIAELELGFLIPVEGQNNASGKDSIPLQPLQPEGNGRAKSVTVFSQKEQFDAVYQAMRDVNRRAVLNIGIKARVGVKTWQQVVVGQPSKEQQAAALARRGALFTQVLNSDTLAGIGKMTAATNSTRVTVQPTNDAEQIRVNAIRTMIAQPAALRVNPRAMARPAAVVRPMATAHVAPQAMVRPAIAMPIAAQPVAFHAVAPAMRMARVMPAAGAVPAGALSAAVLRPAVVRPVVAAQPAAAAARPVAVTRAAPVAMTARPVLSAVTLSHVNTPVLAKAILASDLKVKGRAAVPVQIGLGANQEPAIIDTELESQQEVAFRFDPAADANRDVFATQGFDSRIHLLLTLLLTVNNRTRTVYQDNLMREVIHVAPSEFRLVRDQEAPYLPGIAFLPADFGTADANPAEAELLYQMVMNYELEPWIDPDTIDAARNELARQGLVARFTPILPREAKLTLDLDLLGADQQRTNATVEAATGITDTLVFDNDVFTRIWRERLARPGFGIGGRVRYQLFDGTDAESKVQISFWGTSADVFDIDFLGAVDGQPGRYRISVRNKIESPVTMEGLPASVLGPDIVATPIDSGAILNRQLKPQQTVEIDYQVTPPDTPVVDLAPLVYGTVEPNLNALLKVLMLSPGFKSRSFTVEVSAPPAAFGSVQGSETLTGLLVEFDDGTRAQLSAETPTAEVTLVGRLIDQLLGAPDDQQRYFYRVTNLYASGEGARTGWSEGSGTNPIQVGVAVVQAVQLDF